MSAIRAIEHPTVEINSELYDALWVFNTYIQRYAQADQLAYIFLNLLIFRDGHINQDAEIDHLRAPFVSCIL